MKIKKIEQILKRRKTIVLYDDTVQWIGDNNALYKLDDMPKIDDHNVFVLFDIAGEQADKYDVQMLRVTEYDLHLQMEDHYLTDNEVGVSESCGLYVDGSVYLPVETSMGVKLIAAEYLAPFAKENYTVYERVINGKLDFVVKCGLFIKAIIAPVQMPNVGEAIKRLLQQITASNETEREGE